MPVDKRAYNPLRGGISISVKGPKNMGTLGIILRDSKEASRYFMLTAFHVIGYDNCMAGEILHPAAFNDVTPSIISKWDKSDVANATGFRWPAVQQEKAFNGTFEDYVAIEIKSPYSGFVNNEHVGWVTGIGKATGVCGQDELKTGTELMIRGAATGQVTWCTVSTPSANITVANAEAKGIILIKTTDGSPFSGSSTDAPSQGGDSGAVAMTKDGNRLVGILHGRCRAEPGTSILFPIDRVMKFCGLKL